MKKTILSILLIFWLMPALAQNNFHLTQFFRNAPAYNPGFTGIDNFTDVKLGYRQQWTGIDNSAQTLYASVYGILKRSKYDKIKNSSLRISDPSMMEGDSENFSRMAAIQHGIGGYIMNDEFGPFSRTYGYLTYALHYPLTRKIYLSIGLAAGLDNTIINTSKVQVNRPDQDRVYQAFLATAAATNDFNVNTGLLLYSDKFHLGYSAQRLLQNQVFQNDEISADRESMLHILNAGFNLQIGNEYVLSPGVMTIIQTELPIVTDVNARLRYLNSYWLGVNYRTSQALSLMGGAYLNDRYSLSYSYDFSLDGVSQYMQGSHEVVLGIMLSNKSGSVPFNW